MYARRLRPSSTEGTLLYNTRYSSTPGFLQFSLKYSNAVIYGKLKTPSGDHHRGGVVVFAPHMEGLEFEPTLTVRIGTDSSSAKPLAISLNITGPQRYPYKRVSPVMVGVAQ